jgi:DNA polymerase (family 10)
MSNADIAEVFSEMATLLEVKGENPFKVRAYQRVTETIANLTEELAAIKERDELHKIPGVGASTAGKIVELLDTGKCQHHQELLKEFPSTVFDLLRIPGVGPKTAKMLLDEKITTIEELEQAAGSGRLRTLRGMGEKTEQEILRGIARLREYSQRTNLGVAWDMAQWIMRELREKAPVDQIEAAGSLRRMKETIGDLDILVTSERPEAVMDVFVALAEVEEVLTHGATKSSVVTTAGIQTDLLVVAPESWGAALQYFTGSKQHSIRLRDIAVRAGLKLNEYGVFRVKGDKETRIGGRTEEEMYGALKLPLMPPELREDLGEIEAARAGTLPELIELSDIRGDLQMHSTWSDGRHSIADMARAAKALGYRYIAITDHSPSETVANGLTVERLRKRVKEIEAARKAVPGIAILNGSEVDIKRDGSLDYPDQVLVELDFVVASVHSGWKMDRASMTARMVKALENPWVDALGHPTGRLIGQREPYEVDMEAVLEAAARLGVAVEINAYPDRLDLKDVHARRAKELGVKLVINTDAHAADQLPVIHFGVATARRGWIEAGDVLNTLPLAALRRSLRRARPAGRPRARSTRKLAQVSKAEGREGVAGRGQKKLAARVRRLPACATLEGPRQKRGR